MGHKTAFRLISALSKDEYKRFNDFISSPFFNKRSDVIKLTEYLNTLYPDFEEGSVSYENIYKVVYGNGAFSKQVVKNLLNRFLTLSERFIIQLGVEDDEFSRSIIEFNEYAKRNLTKQAEKTADAQENSLKQSEKYSFSLFKKLYDLSELKNELISADNNKQRLAGNKNRYSAALKFFIMALLRIANEYEVYRFVESEGEPDEYLDRITEYIDFEKLLGLIKKNDPEEYGVFAVIYYSLLSKTSDPEGLNRARLKELAFSGIGGFREMDNIEIWQNIFASHMFSKSAAGPVDSRALHEANKFYINNNVINKDNNGYVIDTDYHNIAMQAIGSRDFKWAEDFINKYKPMLEPEKRENTYNFLMAYYNQVREDYKNVIPFLSRIKTTDILTNLTVRAMLTRAYYELGHYFEAESSADAFKKFLSQSGRITKEARSTYPEFVYFITHLIKAKLSGKKLKDEIYLKADKIPSFINKKWMMEKMRELR